MKNYYMIYIENGTFNDCIICANTTQAATAFFKETKPGALLTMTRTATRKEMECRA